MTIKHSETFKPVKPTEQLIDFSNTEIAFSDKSDEELKKMAWLFGLMNKAWLVKLLNPLGLMAVRWHLPFSTRVIKATIFRQFVGGTTLLESQKVIKRLYDHNILSILDYGAEAKESEKDFNITMNENIRAIEFAYTHESVPVVSCKITGLARFGLLESIQKGEPFSRETRIEYRNILKRIDSICHVAHEKGVGVFIDAEESWIQDAIDHLVYLMMKRYNRKRVIVYNTFQMYRHDRLQYLMDAHSKAQEEGYLLGAKLVRGAYMDKERARAEDLGYPSPIHPNKKATDDAYNLALNYCIQHYEEIAICNASHNEESNMLFAKWIHEKRLPKGHPHLNFCQLYGMSDHISYNLANAGYNVAKYLIYGQIEEVVPYLTRRAKENAAVTGDMSREYELILREIKRRKL
ncbi:MAG TPA: proline dehydrogenase [Phaeodactylibacter sp.]|nr:proline dehydrogenase [Phaeodactylibacter sp.]